MSISERLVSDDVYFAASSKISSSSFSYSKSAFENIEYKHSQKDSEIETISRASESHFLIE